MPDYFVPQLQRLQAAPSSALKLPNGIGWVRASDGAYVAYEQGYDTDAPSQVHAGNQHLEGAVLAANTQNSHDQALVQLSTGDTPTNRGAASITVAHEDLTNPTPAWAAIQLIAAPQFRNLLKNDGTSDYVQNTDTTYVKTPAARSGFHLQSKSDRGVEVYRAAGNWAADTGWHPLPVDTYGYDGQNWYNMWTGTGFGAYETGWYEVTILVEITNNTGTNNEFAIGNNAIESFALEYVPNTLAWCLNATRVVYMGAGNIFTPGYFVASNAGFGCAGNAAKASWRRVA
jgi:hypothetical protein